jgi:hypothetical protein
MRLMLSGNPPPLLAAFDFDAAVVAGCAAAVCVIKNLIMYIFDSFSHPERIATVIWNM